MTKKTLVILVLLFAVLKSSVFLSQYAPRIKTWVMARGNYDALRHVYRVFALVDQARPGLLRDHVSVVAVCGQGLDLLAAKYALLPVKVADSAATVLDLGDSVPSPGPEKKADDAGPGYSSGYPSGRIFTGFLIMALANILLGLLTMGIRRRQDICGYTGWCIATAYLVGFTVLTMGIWLCLVLGARLDRGLIAAVWFLCAGAAMLVPRGARRVSSPPDMVSGSRVFPAVLAAVAVFIVAALVSEPVQNWDSMNWLIKAKLFYFAQSLDLSYAPRGYHSYPVLWPLNIAMQYAVIGGPYDEVARWTAAVFFLVSLSQLAWGLKILGIRPSYIPVGLLVFLAFFFSENPFLSAMPENAFLALQAGLLALALAAFLQKDTPAPRRTAVILAMGLALVKLEGFVVIALLVAAFVLARKRRLLPGDLTLVLALSATMALPMLWIWWLKGTGVDLGVIHLAENLTLVKLWLIVREYGRYLLLSPEGIAGAFFGGFVVVIWRRQRRLSALDRFFLVPVVGLLLFRGAAVLFWPTRYILAKGIFPDGMWRLLLHASPFILLLWARHVLPAKIGRRPEA